MAYNSACSTRCRRSHSPIKHSSLQCLSVVRVAGALATSIVPAVLDANLACLCVADLITAEIQLLADFETSHRRAIMHGSIYIYAPN